MLFLSFFFFISTILKVQNEKKKLCYTIFDSNEINLNSTIFWNRKYLQMYNHILFFRRLFIYLFFLSTICFCQNAHARGNNSWHMTSMHYCHVHMHVFTCFLSKFFPRIYACFHADFSSGFSMFPMNSTKNDCKNGSSCDLSSPNVF